MMTHSGMLWYVDYNQRYWPTSTEARGMIALPLFHKNAMRGTVKPALFAGASFVLMPGYEPKGYLEALAKQTSEPVPISVTQAEAFLRGERETWSHAVRSSGATMD
jgi:acyl-CoA synthetase (AMP-forming)/AMP-acid ligase II